MRKQLVQFTGFFVLSLIGFGCNFGPPTPPSIPLTSSQVRAVLACQDEIKEEGRNFTTVKLAHVEECLDNDSGKFALQISSSPGLLIPPIPLDAGCVAPTRPAP